MDLITEKLAEKVKRKITAIKKAETPLVETTYGQVDIQEVLENRIITRRTEELPPMKCSCTDEHHCTAHSPVNNHSFQAIKIAVTNPVDRIQFEKWLKQLPETLVRGKGIVQLTETEGVFQFQYASKQLKLTRVKEPSKIAPCLILIGVDLDSKKIEGSYIESFNR